MESLKNENSVTKIMEKSMNWYHRNNDDALLKEDISIESNIPIDVEINKSSKLIMIFCTLLLILIFAVWVIKENKISTLNQKILELEEQSKKQTQLVQIERTNLQTEVENSQKKVQNLQSQKNELTGLLSNMDSEKTKLEETLSKAKLEQEELKKKSQVWQNQKKEVEDRLNEKLQNQRNEYETQLSRVNKEKTEIETSLAIERETAKTEQSKLQAEVQRLHTEVQNLHSQKTEIETSLAIERETAKTEQSKLQAEVQRLETEVQNLLGQKNEKEVQLNRKKQLEESQSEARRKALEEKSKRQEARRKAEEEAKNRYGKNIPLEVWENSRILHEGETILDMTSQTWKNLSWQKQMEYAKQYQTNYAEAKNLQVSQICTTLSGVEFPMKLIPPGKFLIGSPSNEPDRSDDETQVEVIMPQAMYVGETEITQKQWQGIMGNNPSYFKGDDLPVEQISWKDSITFCGKIAGCRLLSEYEWEYACRAGTTTPFNIGPNISPNVVNYCGDYPYNNTAKGEYRVKTVACGSLANANAWGLYDMHGNVWEWCLDEQGKSYSSGIQNANNIFLSQFQNVPAGNCVVRGGSWADYAQGCRSACRSSNNHSGSIVGTRLMMFLP